MQVSTTATRTSLDRDDFFGYAESVPPLIHPTRPAPKVCYNPFTMHQFSQDHVFILPHAHKYRKLYDVSIEEVLTCLNTPDTNVGLTTDHYTAEKAINGHHIYVYYYLTYPVQATDTQVYAIVDFIGYTGAEDLSADRQDQPTKPDKN